MHNDQTSKLSSCCERADDNIIPKISAPAGGETRLVVQSGLGVDQLPLSCFRLPRKVVMLGFGPVQAAWGAVLDLFSVQCDSYRTHDQASERGAFPEAKDTEEDPFVWIFEDFRPYKNRIGIVEEFIQLRFGQRCRLPIVLSCQDESLQQLLRWDLFRPNAKMHGQTAIPFRAGIAQVLAAMSKMQSYRPIAYQLILGPFQQHQTVLTRCVSGYDNLKNALDTSPCPENAVRDLIDLISNVGIYLEFKGIGHPWAKLRQTVNRLALPAVDSPELLLSLRSDLRRHLGEVIELLRGMMVPL